MLWWPIISANNVVKLRKIAAISIVILLEPDVAGSTAVPRIVCNASTFQSPTKLEKAEEESAKTLLATSTKFFLWLDGVEDVSPDRDQGEVFRSGGLSGGQAPATWLQKARREKASPLNRLFYIHAILDLPRWFFPVLACPKYEHRRGKLTYDPSFTGGWINM